MEIKLALSVRLMPSGNSQARKHQALPSHSAPVGGRHAASRQLTGLLDTWSGPPTSALPKPCPVLLALPRGERTESLAGSVPQSSGAVQVLVLNKSKMITILFIITPRQLRMNRQNKLCGGSQRHLTSTERRQRGQISQIWKHRKGLILESANFFFRLFIGLRATSTGATLSSILGVGLQTRPLSHL